MTYKSTTNRTAVGLQQVRNSPQNPTVCSTTNP